MVVLQGGEQYVGLLIWSYPCMRTHEIELMFQMNVNEIETPWRWLLRQKVFYAWIRFK